MWQLVADSSPKARFFVRVEMEGQLIYFMYLCTMKICTKCKVNKNLEDFCFRSISKGIRQTVCKECQKTYKLKYYYNNKQSHYLRNRKTIKQLKSFVDDFKSKTGCLLCEESDSCCLDFHHLNPSTKIKEVSLMVREGSKKRILNEIEKCVCLCANCHRKVHAGVLKL